MMKKLITLITVLLGCISVVVGQSCPTGWKKSSTYCYFFNNKDTVTWLEAQNECTLRMGKLLRIEDTTELNFINTNLAATPSGNGYWTALNDRDPSSANNGGTGTWLWSNDEYPATSILSWAQDPNANIALNHCGVILQSGQFSHRNCSQANNYICRQQLPNQQYTAKFGCGDWERAGHKCYMVYSQPAKSWTDAKTYCQSVGARLMKIESTDEMNWLSYQSKTAIMSWQGYWIGLSDTSSRWRWTDGSLANTALLLWNQEPDNWVGGNEDCGALGTDGVFSDNSCNNVRNGFICEMAQKSANCGTGWVLHSQRCYLISSKYTTWQESVDQCKAASGGSGQLLAMNTQDEKTFVLNQLATRTSGPMWYWTGLTDVVQEGLWVYSNPTDNTPTALGLIVWNSEPNNWHGAEHCVDTAFGGRLNDEKCVHKTGFICEKYAAGITAAAGLPTLNFSTLTLTCLALVITASRSHV